MAKAIHKLSVTILVGTNLGAKKGYCADAFFPTKRHRVGKPGRRHEYAACGRTPTAAVKAALAKLSREIKRSGRRGRK